MSTKYLMQALSPLDGAIKSWISATPDWTGLGFPGPGIADADSIALSGGGIDDGSTVPAGAFVDHAGNPFVDHAGNPFV